MHSFFVSLRILFVVSVLWLGMRFASAQDDDSEPLRDFTIELIIFEYTAPSAAAEDWNGPTEKVTDEELPEEPRELSPLRFQGVAGEELELTEIVTKMRLSRDFRPLIHTGWTQPGYGRGEAPALALQRVSRLPARLAGEATLYVSRYLHLTLDLQLAAQPGAVQGLTTSETSAFGETPVFSLNEKRRMRSGELHFFDHPQFGALVKISPVAADSEPG